MSARIRAIKASFISAGKMKNVTVKDASTQTNGIFVLQDYQETTSQPLHDGAGPDATDSNLKMTEDADQGDTEMDNIHKVTTRKYQSTQTDRFVSLQPTKESGQSSKDLKTNLELNEVTGTQKASHSREERYQTDASRNSRKNTLRENDEEDNFKEKLKNVGLFAAKTAAVSGAVIVGIALAVPAIGFTSAGVAAGSLAAAYQSAFLGGAIASGSLFATLQSIGAAGLAATTQAGIVGGSAVGVKILDSLKKKVGGKK